MWPNTSWNGLKPRDPCTESITAKSKRCVPSFKSFSVSKQYDLIIFFKVWWILLRAHWLSGRYTDDLYCLISSSWITCLKTPDIKFEHWSDWTSLGRPTKVNYLIRASPIVLVLIFLKGIASWKRVEAHILVTRLGFGNGPTQFIMILLKDSSNVGMRCNPAWGMTWLGFPNTWQVWQDYSNLKHLPLSQAN